MSSPVLDHAGGVPAAPVFALRGGLVGERELPVRVAGDGERSGGVGVEQVASGDDRDRDALPVVADPAADTVVDAVQVGVVPAAERYERPERVAPVVDVVSLVGGVTAESTAPPVQARAMYGHGLTMTTVHGVGQGHFGAIFWASDCPVIVLKRSERA